jgi:cold shock CspA family protein
LNGAGRHEGVVAEFDEGAGHGRIADDDARWFFHAVAIGDGSRTIAVGIRVTFRVVAGLAGQWEAADVRPAVRQRPAGVPPRPPAEVPRRPAGERPHPRGPT